jgi:hypothetical protein
MQGILSGYQREDEMTSGDRKLFNDLRFVE